MSLQELRYVFLMWCENWLWLSPLNGWLMRRRIKRGIVLGHERHD